MQMRELRVILGNANDSYLIKKLEGRASFGIEMETGSHFFKLVLTNTTRMNLTQFLGGTPHPLDPDAWRVGFNVTRLPVF